MQISRQKLELRMAKGENKGGFAVVLLKNKKDPPH